MNINDLLSNNIIWVLVIIWDVVWRGIAMWRTAQQKKKIWFVVLLLINSVGILPLIYLLFIEKGEVFGKKKKSKKKK